MKFALRYRTDRGYILTAWQSSLSVIRDMADFYENKGYEIVSIRVKYES